jgi:L-alanine-DL-glutamate epimerase-like enolase superfamily enzyme
MLLGRDASAVTACSEAMSARLRNAGRSGAGMMAISAVDVALWDLNARRLDVALVDLLGPAHHALPVYGSGGFTSYPLDRLSRQLEGWVDDGIRQVKIKVGREPDADPARLDTARKAIGDSTALFVDANGALDRTRAREWAERFRREWDVSWFEEPVTSDDVDGLRLVRDRAPAGIDIAAGEYGSLLGDFAKLLDAGAVDCLQADVTRCGGVTGVGRVIALAEAHQIDVSAHGAPALSAHAFAGARHLRHLEYFHDHTRLEHTLFDGVGAPVDGALRPERDRPGLGLVLKRADVDRYCVAAAGR